MYAPTSPKLKDAFSIGEANVSLQGQTQQGDAVFLCVCNMTLQINEGKHYRYTYQWEFLKKLYRSGSFFEIHKNEALMHRAVLHIFPCHMEPRG